MHPHIAEIHPGVPTPTFAQPDSNMPMFNLGNGTWDMGEGFRVGSDADHGGWLTPDDADLEVGDIHSAGWFPFAGPPTSATPLQRMAGLLWPAGAGTPPTPISEAESSFEVFAPVTYDPNRPIVVVVIGWATQGGPPSAWGGRYAYPGIRLDGLVPVDWNDWNDPQGAILRPGPDPVRIHDFVPAGGPQLITIYMVTRTFGRPLTFACQRSVHAAKVVDLLLSTPSTDPTFGHLHPPTFPVLSAPVDVPRMAAGGSFGGLTAQVLLQAYPDVFSGAFVGSFNSSLRQVMGEQFTYEYICRRTGTAPIATALQLLDALEWPFYLRQRGLDYFNTSTTLRLRRGELRGPVHFLISDEDTVACGTDFLPLLSGVRGYREQFRDQIATHAAFTVVDRRDHQRGLFETPYDPAVLSFAMEKPAAEMAVDVANLHGMSWPWPTLVADDGSEDPYEMFLERGLHQPYVPSPTDLLELDPAFGSQGRSVGQGLTLGFDESLKVHDVPVPGGGTERSIFVGSAEGVVTRFVPQVVDPTLPPELAAAASSESLGYGAWAIAVGELDAGNAGPEVVVGVHRDLYVLDARQLTILRSVHLGFEHTRPRRVQVAEVFGTVPGKEIVFVTFHGHLVVMDAQLQVLCDLGEPGIQDFIVHEGATYPWATQTASKVPVSILSHRGHVANITLDLQPDPTQQTSARLHCWTEGMLGIGNDLELFEMDGRTWLAVATAAEGGYPIVHVFDPLQLTPPKAGKLPLATYTPSPVDVRFPAGFATDIAPVESNGSLLGFVFVHPGGIGWIDGAGAPTDFTLTPDTFGPATGPVAIAVADLFGRASSLPGSETLPHEVVLSTKAGHVVAFHFQDLIAAGGGLELTLPGTNRPSGPTLPYTNRTLAGTWGMTTACLGSPCSNRLVVAHHAGSLFEVDPNDASWGLMRDMLCPKYEVQNDSFIWARTVTPVRDLAQVGSGVVAGDAQERRVHTPPATQPGSWTLTSRPWQNAVSSMDPLWYQDPPPGTTLPVRPSMIAYDGFMPFSYGGDALEGSYAGTAGTVHVHHWSGQAVHDPNLMLGADLDATTALANWYSTTPTSPSGPAGAPDYGPGPAQCKDFRNAAKETDLSANNLQSLRVVAFQGSPLVVATTPGGSVVLVRPGKTPGTDLGQILWDSNTPQGHAWDDGFGAMGLAVRKVPIQFGTMSMQRASFPEEALDVFVGLTHAHRDPSGIGPGTPNPMVGAVRWLRWNGSQMQQMGPLLTLDVANDPTGRGGFCVSGVAVGDLLLGAEHPGAELVVTTLAGDLYVFGLGTSQIVSTPKFRTWVPGALGAYNSIVIGDLDATTGVPELYVAGSMGIWKWRRKLP